jgi:hypothetical protein
VSSELQSKLIADIERQNIRVAKSPNEQAEYTLRGYVVSSLEKKGQKAKISYIWDVTDASGKGVHRVSGEETAKAATGTSPRPRHPTATSTPTDTTTSPSEFLEKGSRGHREPAAFTSCLAPGRA